MKTMAIFISCCFIWHYIYIIVIIFLGGCVLNKLHVHFALIYLATVSLSVVIYRYAIDYSWLQAVVEPSLYIRHTKGPVKFVLDDQRVF